MPQIIQPILATVDKDATLNKIAEVANLIMEHTSMHTTIASSTTVQKNNELKTMVAQIAPQMEVMNKQLDALTIHHLSGRSFSKNRYLKSRSHSNIPISYCWYHNHFHKNAQKCILPYAFKIRAHIN